MVASIWLHALLDIFKKLNSVFCLTAQMEILCSVLTITSLGCKWPELELCPTPTIKLWLQETPQQPDFLSWAFSYLPPHSTLHEYCWLKGATSRKSIPRPSLEIWILRNQFGTDWLTNDWTLKRLFIFYPREREDWVWCYKLPAESRVGEVSPSEKEKISRSFGDLKVETRDLSDPTCDV